MVEGSRYMRRNRGVGAALSGPLLENSRARYPRLTVAGVTLHTVRGPPARHEAWTSDTGVCKRTSLGLSGAPTDGTHD